MFDISYLMARTTLIRDFGMPIKFVEALLPRFRPIFMPLHPYTVEVDDAVCDHKNGSFDIN